MSPSTAPPASDGSITLRPLQSGGDLGWVIARHGALYWQEFGWDWRFEALVAQIAVQFVERYDPQREAAWLAERQGEDGAVQRLGCIFLVQARDEAAGTPEPGTAQLRLLLLEPEARGLGLGKRLVRQCSEFARSAGYQRIRLWTNSLLMPARGIYQREGYQLTGSKSHCSFGHELVGETWELDLNERPGSTT